MDISWSVTDEDIKKVRDLIEKEDNYFVKQRISRNIKRENINLDKNSILRVMIMCLLTSQQRSGPNTPISIFLNSDNFLLTEQNLNQVNDVESYVKDVLFQNNLKRYINRIALFLSENFKKLQSDNHILDDFLKKLDGNATMEIEREIADKIQDMFKGFGPKQSRNFLQSLGLTKYEIPIDSRIINWLNTFGFPIPLSSVSLQDKGYYHFVSDGIQFLCKKSNILPCVLDAAIFSSFDNEEWKDNDFIF